MAKKPDPNFDPDFASAAQWAAIYRAYGLQIIPCYSPTEVKPGTAWKRPLLSTWTTLQEQLVPDATFNRWYDPTTGEHRGRRNMGIITGRCSDNCYILDLDIHKTPAAAHWWQSVLDVHNNSMGIETPTQKTGGGGLQLLLQAPVGFNVPTNKTSAGVDIRGQGGFAVVPASLHESGKFYEWLPGKAPWELPILMSPQWLLDEILKLIAAHGGTATGAHGQRDRNPPPDGEFDDFGNQTDGREDAMFRMVWRVIVKLYRTNPIRPVGAEEQRLMEAEYEVYEAGKAPKELRPGESRRDGLNREGRGPLAWGAKWRAAMKRWDTKVRDDAGKPDPNPDATQDDPAAEFQEAAQKAEADAKADPSQRYPYLNVRQIKQQPEPLWLVDELISEKIVGFIFGAYGTLKTFIGFDIGLSIATGQPAWWGRKLSRRGAVVYLCVEGSNRLKYRLQAWEQHRGVTADDSPFFLVEKTINFMNGADVGKLEATVQAIKDEAGCEIAAVFVDTVSRVLPGAKENQQEHMSLFVAACDRVRERFAAAVIGLHHSNKEGFIRGSTVIPGAGDFLLEVRREPGEMRGSIFAHKVKDAEDGWEKPFTVTKVTLDGFGRTSLVIDQDDSPETGKGEWPDKDVLRKVLAEIGKAWLAGKPWSASPNSRDRFASRIMWVKFGLPAKLAKNIIETWLINEVLSEEVIDLHSKVRGLKVVGGID